MAEVYRVPLEDLRQWTRLLSRLGRDDQWWHQARHRDWLSAQYAELIEVEDAATSLTSIQLQIVPGLLQTDDYSRAVLENSALPVEAERINAMVSIRQVRQRRLFDPRPPMRAAFILSEAVLDLRYGDRAVHVAQLQQMCEFAKRSNIEIRIIPYSQMIDLSSVDMYELSDGSAVVYTESLVVGSYIENRYPLDDVERVRMAILNAQQRALPPVMSIAAIEQRIG